MGPLARFTLQLHQAAAFLAYPSAFASNNSPNEGALWYNGGFYLGSWFRWTDPPTWEGTSPGYEHDLYVRDPDFFTSSCITYSTLPDRYDDCPTAGVLDPHGPVFSFGTFDATRMQQNEWYYGGWLFSSHGNAWYSPFKLLGQENEGRCVCSSKQFGACSLWIRMICWKTIIWFGEVGPPGCIGNDG